MTTEKPKTIHDFCFHKFWIPREVSDELAWIRTNLGYKDNVVALAASIHWVYQILKQHREYIDSGETPDMPGIEYDTETQTKE